MYPFFEQYKRKAAQILRCLFPYEVTPQGAVFYARKRVYSGLFSLYISISKSFRKSRSHFPSVFEAPYISTR